MSSRKMSFPREFISELILKHIVLGFVYLPYNAAMALALGIPALVGQWAFQWAALRYKRKTTPFGQMKDHPLMEMKKERNKLVAFWLAHRN